MEMIAVVTIASLLAATVIPSFGHIRQARRDAGVLEIERTLAYARERAMAAGTPVGVRFDLAAHTLTLLVYTDEGVASLGSPLGEPLAPIELLGGFTAQIGRFRIDLTGSTGPGPDEHTVWFDHRGIPHLRTVSGDFRGELREETTVDVLDAGRVVIHPVSGMVEVP